MAVYIEDLLPGVKYNGLNTKKAVDFSGAPSVALPSGTTIAGAQNFTSTSATAFTVAASGTNYGLQVDESTASAATGLKIKPAAASAGLALSVISSGTDENLKVDAKGAGTISINTVATGNIVVGSGWVIGAGSNGSFIGTTSSANAFTVGANGSANPGLNVSTSTASSATGINITSAAAGSGVAIAAISSGTDEKLTIDAKGAGDITIGKTSTGYTVVGKLINLGALTNIATQNGTPTVAQLVGGYINHNSVTGAGTLTLPAGATLDGATFNLGTGSSFYCWYYNSGSQTVTITGASGTTVQGGTAAVTTGKSALLFFVRITTSTWICFPTTLV